MRFEIRLYKWGAVQDLVRYLHLLRVIIEQILLVVEDCMLGKALDTKFLSGIVFFLCLLIFISADLIIVAMGIGYATYEQLSKNTRRDFNLRVDYIHIKQIFGLTMKSNRNRKLIGAIKISRQRLIVITTIQICRKVGFASNRQFIR